jgi:enoyl-CoA hydratase/carnithine racemase
MVLLGRSERLDAARALELGLVSEVVPDDRLLDRALELATTVAQASPAAVQASLRAIWGSLDRGLDEALREGWDIILDHRGHPDAVEGPRAFAERRAPRWEGS